MKTAISIPDDVFREADSAANRLGWSRSQLYTRAVREFLERQEEDSVTAALNDIADGLNSDPVPAVGRSLIESGAWQW
ncbi:hypothetical protein GII33_20015 [Gordonia pseudamarae]|mgnify:CR=1 FL=1|jgi:predicted transcriptional regulator|uniref:Ribbon-helix-helix protein CopG domain-containing protein n=1 Tax=Gordonia pseudamarae TaxID=2831662 RepID=A0ABX6IN29_9ACTN|nr:MULTISPECIES: hypothetical protein [Gordonia]MBD0021796.1 hypothetical protein [Gordonia sp. (in: high G+C Gram-positive bacteria)]QHN27921.1 hypothetical protein GII33_20015 [Gordonia pseudamarae]QHN36779.1 hypothetical protein GII31_19635 [Gordonia pseudamarae]